MLEQHQRLCARIGVTFLPMLLIALAIAGFLQPPSPALTAQEIQQLYLDNQARIRIGIWIATAAAPLLAFYVAALSHLLRSITQGPSPLATAQTIVGSCLILEFIFPQMVWQTAAYRANRSAEMIQMLNDVGWLCYVGVVGTAIAQMIIIAIVIFQDRRSEPLVPRWCAYLCLWSALGVAGGGFCIFVTSGPVAWNGLIAWWLLVVSFFIWMMTMTMQMIKVSHRMEKAQSA